MEMKRRLARAVSVLAVALAAGHLVQTMNAKSELAAAAAAAEKAPKAIVQVAAGPAVPTTAPQNAPIAAPANQPAVSLLPTAPATPGTATASAPAAVQTAALAGDAVGLPDLLKLPALPSSPPAKAETPIPPQPAVTATCDAVLDVMIEPDAQLGLTLVSPCRLRERVVVRHAGLAITARTSPIGTLSLSIPALQENATVSILFADQATAAASIQVPDMAGMRRFAVQWIADDHFQLHAYEGDAQFGENGHVSAAQPGTRLSGVPVTGGYLDILGDSSVETPMLAEVYTYPADAKAAVDVIVEATITPQTCGRELLGETIAMQAGKVEVTDLTLAMSGCDAVGDIVVLKNLVPDLKIAAN